MPIYEYQCSECGQKQEVLQKLSDPPLKDCPACGQPALTKLVSAAGFQLKGSGWYVTDFRGGKSPKADAGKSTEPGKPGEAAATATETKSKEESKPATTASSSTGTSGQ